MFGRGFAASDDLPSADREIALVDLLDRLLAGGVVLTGDLTLSIAEVDLVHISLRALITSVAERDGTAWNPFSNDPP
ncbi:gas vesicle protein [Saccharopolyspora rhizosphaerae]|uniref:Gas vesicle protein n=1 Tax=Saccharopolyspora rhizosphaerae TaxID=2492662 RepID=A0A3R8QDY4_9PSEU|nr:gas vesicle protein [Saccharopolyspora rhizosphaerae]RRO18793.1 gas vesicle protein [Saccharopolyspora rhizosphaerae]